MLARLQRRTSRQIFLSTHSPDLLRDDGIGRDEVLLLSPSSEGTGVTMASSHQDVRDLLESALSIAEIMIPRTRPEQAAQLSLFGDQ